MDSGDVDASVYRQDEFHSTIQATTPPPDIVKATK